MLDYGSGEHPYIAMELVEGPSLQRIVDGTGALPPGLAVRLVARIAEGLAAAHERGIVHRDLKPGNVHVIVRDDDVEVRILDFGLALLDPGRNEVATRLTRAGLVAGTPEYMAPEQIRGEPTDGRTDLYALGVMLFELLVGAPPFAGDNATAIVSAHLQSPIPPLPLGDLERSVRNELDATVRALLAKDPNDRPASAADVARTLVRIATRLPEVKTMPWVLGPSDPSAPTIDLATERTESTASSATAWQVTGNAAADRECLHRSPLRCSAPRDAIRRFASPPRRAVARSRAPSVRSRWWCFVCGPIPTTRAARTARSSSLTRPSRRSKRWGEPRVMRSRSATRGARRSRASIVRRRRVASSYAASSWWTRRATDARFLRACRRAPTRWSCA